MSLLRLYLKQRCLARSLETGLISDSRGHSRGRWGRMLSESSTLKFSDGAMDPMLVCVGVCIAYRTLCICKWMWINRALCALWAALWGAWVKCTHPNPCFRSFNVDFALDFFAAQRLLKTCDIYLMPASIIVAHKKRFKQGSMVLSISFAGKIITVSSYLA